MLAAATLLLSSPSLTLKVKLSSPLKSVSGVYVRPGAVPLKEPFVGSDITVKVMGSPSGSLPVRVISIDSSSFVASVWSSATGASLTSFTVILTFAILLSIFPSLILKVKLSLPLKSGSGVYVRSGAVPLKEPFAGPDVTVKVKGSPSGSLPVRAISMDSSSSVVSVLSYATGGVL